MHLCMCVHIYSYMQGLAQYPRARLSVSVVAIILVELVYLIISSNITGELFESRTDVSTKAVIYTYHMREQNKDSKHLSPPQ